MSPPEPLGKVFSELANAYASLFVERLSHLPIKRYYYALVVIDSHGGDLSQTTLAKELYIDKASVVRMLDYLEEEGCIIRRQNPSDRRAHQLELTPEAHALIPEIRRAISETDAVFASRVAELDNGNFPERMRLLMHDLMSKTKSGYNIQFISNDED